MLCTHCVQCGVVPFRLFLFALLLLLLLCILSSLVWSLFVHSLLLDDQIRQIRGFSKWEMRNESNLNQIEWSLVSALWKKYIAHKKPVDSAFFHLYLRWNCAGCVDPYIPETYAMQAFKRWPSSSWMCDEIKMVHMRFYLSGHAIILGQCIKDWIANSSWNSLSARQVRINITKKESTKRWTMDGGQKKNENKTVNDTSKWLSATCFPYIHICAPWWFSVNFVFISSLACVALQTKCTSRTHSDEARAKFQRRPHDEANLRPLKEN